MPEYSNYVESRLNADTLTGDELIAGSQEGNSRKWTVQQIVALALAGVTVPDGVYGDVTVTDNGQTWTVTTGGTGVTDGDKVGVQVYSGGTVWLPSDYTSVIVSTTGSTITLPSNGKERAHFAGSAAFGTDKDIAFDFDTRLTEWDWIFEISSADPDMDFGADTRSTHANFVDGIFTPADVGLYKVKATRYGPGGTLWLLDFNGVYSVGDAPPEPPTGEYVEYDDGSFLEYDDGSDVEYA